VSHVIQPFLSLGNGVGKLVMDYFPAASERVVLTGHCANRC
jgi:hypothetical protein